VDSMTLEVDRSKGGSGRYIDNDCRSLHSTRFSTLLLSRRFFRTAAICYSPHLTATTLPFLRTARLVRERPTRCLAGLSSLAWHLS
jgi:hypothetical protein